MNRENERLKNKILDLAIRGKLVPQDVNDEPASVLLERIKQERKKLIAEKKIKQENYSEIYKDPTDNHYYEKFENGTINAITEEIPFEIPNTWCWIRIKSAGLYFTNGNYSSKYPKENEFVNEGIPFIRCNNIKNYTITSQNMYYISKEKHEELQKGHLKTNDILITIRGSIGLSGIVPEEYNNANLNAQLTVLRTDETFILSKYLLYLVISPCLQKQFEYYTTGAALKQLSEKNLQECFIAIPPIKEQKRIIKKLDSLLEEINKKDVNENLLLKHKNNLKSKILDKAIQGKLIKQNEDDESAEILINKILDEKRALMKSKEIKKENLSIIYKDSDNQFYEKFDDGKIIDITEEIPFDIPNNWSWVRFNNIMDIRDGTHDSPKYHSSGIPLLTSKNLSENGLDLKNINYISLEDSKKINERSKVDDGDILFAMIGSIGNPVVVKKEFEFSIKNMALFKNLYNINKKYIYYVLKIMQEEMKKNASGGVQKFVSLNYLRKFLIPFPPEKEQERIIDKIENTFKYIK